MRPYFAIIKDSFRAALASRVLYVLLAIIVLVLLALAPLHIREALDTRINFDDIDGPSAVAQRLFERKDDPNRPGAKRIWDSLPENIQERVSESFDENSESDQAEKEEEKAEGKKGKRQRGDSRERGSHMNLISEVNDLIEDPEFYHAEDWEGRMDAEARELADLGVESLTTEQAARLNRILVGRELGIGTGSRTAVGLYYAIWKWTTIGQTRQQFATLITSLLPWVFDKFVLSLGLLIAILVTANIIPETFEAGSLNLLLSKPVSRTGLFLSKFFGGCIFVTLCATLLFIGLWLWLGFGMKIWDRSMLISIPLYILVFMIYYSVSAFVGLMSRSVILAVIATGVFWATCFGIGSSYLFFNNRMENSEVVDVTLTPNGIVQSNSFHMVSTWKESDSTWDVVTDADLSDEEFMQMNTILYAAEMPALPSRLGPIYDPASKTVIAGRLLLGDPSSMNRQDLMMGAEGEELKAAGRFKRDSVGLFAAKDGPLVVTKNGEFYRMKLDSIDLSKIASADKPEDEEAEAEESGEDAQETEDKEESKQADSAPEFKSDEVFVEIGPDSPVFADSDGAVDFNYSNEEIAIYTRGKISVFGLDADGQYEFLRSMEIETGTRKSMSCSLAYQGNTVFLALGNGQIITLDGQTLAEKMGYLPESKFAITEVRGSYDGRFFAVCYRNEKLWILDTENDETMTKANVGGQGTISAVSFHPDNQMLVGDRTDRITIYSLPDFKASKTYSPSGNMIDKCFRYGLKPLYKAFPKPGEFYKVVTHLADTSDTSRNPNVDLKRQDGSTDPWSPLISGLGFMIGMLALSCFVFWRKDY